jgi:hypothetical protein
MLSTGDAGTTCHDRPDSDRLRRLDYGDGLTVDVDGHAPSEVDAVTEGVAFVAVDV